MAVSRSSNPIFRLVFMFFLVATIAVGALITPARADDPGYALAFDGVRQYVRLGNTSTVMGNPSWTGTKSVTLWVKVTGNTPPATTPNAGEMILSTDQPRLFGINRAIYAGQDRLWAWNVDSGGPDYVGVDFTSGVWMHLAIVHQGGILSLYKNGIFAGSVASGTTYIPNATNVGVLFLGGSGRTDTSTYFDGQVDEVAFWDTALDLPSISGLMDSVITDVHPLWSHLKAYYRMSDGTGTSLNDDSAYANTGTLLGGMSDVNWVLSGAFGGGSLTTPSATSTATRTPTLTSTLLAATSTATRTPTSTLTIIQVTSTATATATRTRTPQPFTATPTLTITPFLPSPTATRTASPTVTPTSGSSGGSMTQVGLYDSPGNPHDVAVVNGLAYLADSGRGLRVVNVADPALPVEMGFYDTPGQASGVAVQGGYAYVADARSGLRIVNISDPARPAEIGFYDTPGYAYDVAVGSGYAYVADRWEGLRIIDISNPASPVEVGVVPTSDEALSVVLSGNCAYISAYGSGLYVVDVSSPNNPFTLGIFDTVNAYGVQVDGHYAYIADGGNGLRLIDVSSPAAPAQVGVYDTPGWSRSLRVVTNLAYVADWTHGVAVVNVSNPASPAGVTQYQTPGRVRDVDVVGSYIYAADFDYGLRVLAWR